MINETFTRHAAAETIATSSMDEEGYTPAKLHHYLNARTVRDDLAQHFGFTAAELVICDDLVKGMDPSEIAVSQTKSVTTVRDHIANMVKKIGKANCADNGFNASLLLRRCITAPIDPDQLPDITNLTSTELRVASRLIRGYQSSTIADQMGLSIHTIGDHKKAIHHKLGIRTSYQVLALMFVDRDKNEFPPTIAQPRQYVCPSYVSDTSSRSPHHPMP